MANRSDFRSILPRQTKRHLALTSTGDAHRDGEVRRLMIQAHAHELAVRDKKLRSDFVSGEVVDKATQEALVS